MVGWGSENIEIAKTCGELETKQACLYKLKLLVVYNIFHLGAYMECDV